MTTELSRQDNVVDLNPQPTFEDFWKLQYWKTDKLLCMAKWDAITSEEGYHTQIRDKETNTLIAVHLKATPQEIVDGYKRFRRAWPCDKEFAPIDPQFMPRPAQFLNRGKWLDD